MKRLKKKGQAVLYVFWFITAVIIVTIAAVLAPMGVLFNTKMLQAGEDILDKSLDEINAIDDVTVKAAVNDTVLAAKNAGTTNINVNANFFQYSWVIILLITGVITFLQARRLIEVGAGGFV